MDRASSVTAALQAGKFPTQKQIDGFIDYVLESPLLQVDSIPGHPTLTAQGKLIAGDFRDLLAAYKALGSSKNEDDLIQDTFWHLSQADLENTSVHAPVDTDSAKADVKQVGASIRTALSIVWSNMAGEGTDLVQDFASFARLTLADAAELVEVNAAAAKDALRDTEDEVQAGERNPVTGTKKETQADRDADARAKFEKGMDQVKVAGSKVIGVTQDAAESVEKTVKTANARLQDAYYKVCERAQRDPEYREAVTTVLDIVERWMKSAVDAAADVNKDNALEQFIDDPTPEKHVHAALRNVRKFAERLSGGKSLDDLFGAVRTCAADMRSDPDTKTWFNEFFAHARRSLQEVGYLRSDESEKTSEDLGKRWHALLDKDSDYGRKWKKDVGLLRSEFREFQDRMKKEKTLVNIKNAHVKLGRDLGEATATAGAVGVSEAISQGIWMWSDIIKVYLPRSLTMMQGRLIPRTEYVDETSEMILEDLDISTFSLVPGTVNIRNITDIDISAASTGDTDTKIGAMTQIRAQGGKFALKEISFYYYDKTATLGPAEFTGIMELAIPDKAFDIELDIRLIPNTDKGLAERERIKGFHKIEKVRVTVNDELELSVTQSNHAVLLTVFGPVLRSGIRRIIARTLEEQFRSVLEFADRTAWDVGVRAEVFGDTGLPRGPSLLAAMWSEIGHLSKRRQAKPDAISLTEGWQFTGSGIIKRDPQAGLEIGIGVAPQILPGEKHGPKERLAEPIADKLERAAEQAGVDTKKLNTDDAAKAAADAAGQAADLVKQGVQQIQTFKQAVDTKREQELRSDGWKSSAFDL